MASVGISFDRKEFDINLKKFDSEVQEKIHRGLYIAAAEALRLSNFEVPHDTGALQTSGHVDAGDPDDVIVGYNTPYAERLHEHPNYHFQKGRKAKYLEDPIKNNEAILLEYIGNKVKETFNA